MSRAQRVWLNGVELASVHPKVLVQHIDEGPLELKQQTAERYGGGTFLFSNVGTKRQIDISFAIREGLDWPTRAGVYTAVCNWAREGWLELSSRPGQRIYVYCTQLPDLGKLRDWTQDLTITFQALWFPYWQDSAGVTLPVMTGTSGSQTCPLNASHPGLLDLRVSPNAAGLTRFKAWTNGADAITMDFSSRPLGVGQTFTMATDKHGLLTIRGTSTSYLAYRTLDSAENFEPSPPTVNVQFEADVSVSVTATVRGCFI